MQTATAVEKKIDRRAENELVNQFRWLVKAQAQRYAAKDAPLREDLEQVGLIALIEAFREWVPGPQAVSTYAYPRIRWAMLNFLNRNLDDPGSTISLDTTPAVHQHDDGPELTLLDAVGIDPNQEQQMLNDERDVLVARAVEGLPDREQVIISMRFYEGASIKEIASALGVGNSTADLFLQTALRRLRHKLSRDLGE